MTIPTPIEWGGGRYTEREFVDALCRNNDHECEVCGEPSDEDTDAEERLTAEYYSQSND